jgi:hypothetical protein
MLETLTLATFTGLLHTKFRVHLDAEKSVEMELVDARDRGSIPTQEQFALLFIGPRDVRFDQGVYRIEHDRLGAFDLLLVPVVGNEGGPGYEAVFNRLLKA